jgi:polyphosphate glucokinase
MNLLGVDVGGSSIKGAPVDTTSGKLLAAPAALKTPVPTTPAAVAATIRELAARFVVQGIVGVAFPSVVKQGVTLTAANIDRAWIGVNGEELIAAALGRPVALLNDADAAGIAEVRLGAGRGEQGTVMMLTFGTGIGSAVFIDGRLLPNTELGHLEVRGREAEHFASARVRSEEHLDWRAWAERVNVVLERYQALFWPDLIIIGGGVTENYEQFGHLLQAVARIVPASFRAHAGIVGAAIAAEEKGKEGEGRGRKR